MLAQVLQLILGLLQPKAMGLGLQPRLSYSLHLQAAAHGSAETARRRQPARRSAQRTLANTLCLPRSTLRLQRPWGSRTALSGRLSEVNEANPSAPCHLGQRYSDAKRQLALASACEVTSWCCVEHSAACKRIWLSCGDRKLHSPFYSLGESKHASRHFAASPTSHRRKQWRLRSPRLAIQLSYRPASSE